MTWHVLDAGLLFKLIRRRVWNGRSFLHKSARIDGSGGN